MTKSKLIKNWIIYAIILIISIILYVFLNNNITLSIMLLIFIIPILSIIIILINKFKLEINLKSQNEFNLNDSKDTYLKFNKHLSLCYLEYELNELNLNIESLNFKNNEDIFLGFDNKINVKLNSNVLGKYQIFIDKLYLEDVFKLFKFKININLSEFINIKDDFNEDFNLINYLNINEDITKNSNYYKFNNEFDEFNKYKEGDPFNLINWKVSLKSDDLLIKVSKDSVNSNLIVILDTECINTYNFNEYLMKYIEIIKYLINKNLRFSVGFYSFKVNEFVEQEFENLNESIDFLYENLYIKENNLDVLNYYMNNSISKKMIYYVSNKNINEKGVVIIN